MVIKINYTSSDVYVSTSVSPVYVFVNYGPVTSSGAVWGGITGTLSDQTDLQDALDAKFDDPTGTTSQYLRGDGSLATFPSLTGYVPYTGATTNVDLGEYELKSGQVTLDTSPTGTAAVGTTRWNNTIGSSETTLKGGSVILKNGVDLVARVVNKVSPNTTLTKAAYQAVKVSGAQGQRLAVALAQANNDGNSADTIGLVTETIATNQEGFIMTVGQLEGVNTTGSLQGETWVDGDVLYLSGTTAGALTNVKPSAPIHIVVIGYVEYAHANNGKIYVKVMNGWELDELHNVSISSPANNEALIYESSTSLWKNKTIATALGYTPVPTTRTLTINGTAYDLSADRSWTVSSGGTTIYSGDGTLAGNRVVTMGSNTLNFYGSNYVSFTHDNTRTLSLATSNSGSFIQAFSNIGTSAKGKMILNWDGGQVVIGGLSTENANNTVKIYNGFEVEANANQSLLFTNSNSSDPTINVRRAVSNINNGVGCKFSLHNSSSAFVEYATIYGSIATNTAGSHSGYLQFVTTTSGTSSEKMRLTSAGRLLLGTTTESTYLLDVNGTARVSGDVLLTRTSGSGSSLRNYFPTATGTDEVGYGVGKSESAGNSAFFAWKNNSGTPYTTIETYGGSGELRLQAISASGTIKIGETSQTVTIKGTAGLSLTGKYFSISDTASGITFKNYNSALTGTENISYGVGKSETSGNTMFYGWANNSGTPFGYIETYGGGSPIALQRSSGNVLIGTTTNSTYKLDVNGTARVTGNVTIGASPATQNITLDTTSATQNLQFFKSGVYSSYLWVDSNFNHSSSAGGGTYLPFRGSAFIANSASLSEGIVNLTSGSLPNIVRFFATGVTEQGVIGYAAGGNVMQFRTNKATSISNGSLAMAIFENTNVSINSATDVSSAQLQVTSTTKGFLPPRMTTAQRDAITSPATGLQIYNTTTNANNYYDGTAWVAAGGGGTPAGSNTQIQYNNSGAFGASAGLTYVDSTGSLALTKSQNAVTGLSIVNATSGTAAQSAITLQCSGATNNFVLAKYSPTTTPLSWFSAGDAYLYSYEANIDIAVDSSTKLIRFGNTKLGAASMTLTNAGRLLLGTTTESTYLLDVNGTARVSGNVRINSGSTLNWDNVGTALNRILFYDGASTSTRVGFSSFGGQMQIFSYSGDNISFYDGVDGSNYTTKDANFIVSATGPQVAGSKVLKFSNTFSNKILLYDGGTTSTRIGFGTFNGGSVYFEYLDNVTRFAGGVDATNSTNANSTMWLNHATKSVNIGSSSNVASAKLNIESSTQGFLPPRMTNAQRSAISSPAVGLIVYCTDAVEGLYVYKSTGWTFVI